MEILAGFPVNHTPLPYVFRKNIILKEVKVLCFDRLLQEYHSKEFRMRENYGIAAPFVWGDGPRDEGTDATTDIPRTYSTIEISVWQEESAAEDLR